ncbi:MAG: protein-disulfide reductase DsbD domain-containing protein [Alkalilacustris sp.]
MKWTDRVILGAALGGLAGPAAAFSVEDVVEARLLPGWRTAGGTHMAALHVTLAEGWKTYWRAPGENGVPPRFDLSGSENVTGVVAHWPRPTVFDRAGAQVIGFADELVLPLEFTLEDGAAPARLAARVDLGVCEVVCVPVRVDLAVDLPAASAGDARILAALADGPEPATAAGLLGATCSVEGLVDGLRLTAVLEMPRLGADELAIIELDDEAVWVSPAQSARTGERLTAVADLVAMDGGAVALDPAALRITVLAGERAVELMGCAGP